MKSLCKWDKIFLDKIVNTKQKPCYFSLPFAIATLNGKTNCDDLNESDIANFLNILTSCKDAYLSGILYAAAEENKDQSVLSQIFKETNPKSIFLRIPRINENICFKNNFVYIIYEYILNHNYTLSFIAPKAPDSEADENSNNLIEKYSSLWIQNKKPGSNEELMNTQKAYEFYLKEFHHKNYEDGETKVVAINLLGIRQDAAMRFITQDMILVALAISLICITTLLYLRSISIAMIVNLGVALSVGVAFFAYRLVYNIDLFPFINMMAAFLLIGIACDNVYVLFDAWYNEKSTVLMHDYFSFKEINPGVDAKQYLIKYLNEQLKHIDIFIVKPNLTTETKQEENHDIEAKKSFIDSEKKVEPDFDDEHDLEFNPMFVRYAILNEKQMIRVMGGTLRHAASSIFVTSFTTAAAFLTNMITRLPYVQLFGLFTGTCILVYFLMVITMISAFVVLYEKYSNRYICELPSCLKKIRVTIDRVMSLMTSLNAKVVGHYLPLFLIKARLVLFLIFLVIGALSMIAVFHKPKLKPPSQWRYQFFESDNLFEKFEFKMRDKFLSYVNEEKRNLTNPEIFILFGIIDKDTGSTFDPDDDGYLVYDKDFDFFSKESQAFLHKFITETLKSRNDLFLAEPIITEWNEYLNNMKLFCNLPTIDPILPMEPEILKKCQIELNSLLVNSSIETFYEMMAVFPRHIVFIPKGDKIVGILLRVNANWTFTDFLTVREYYLKIEQFNQETFPVAANGYKTGWLISIAFALYDLQYQLITGTYASLITSMGIAFIVLLITSGNIFISFYAIVTISFSISLTVAIFVFLGWELNFLESIIIIMSVGLSVDFSCHYGVAYNKAEIDEHSSRKYKKKHSKLFANNNNSVDASRDQHKLNGKLNNILHVYTESNKERFFRINDSFKRVGSAVAMAAVTTFLAGLSMYPSNLTSFSKMGQFLMLVMFTSYLYATFFFVPLCALFGPTNNFGDIRLKYLIELLNRKICYCFQVDTNKNDSHKMKDNLKSNGKAVKMKTFKKNKNAELNEPNI